MKKSKLAKHLMTQRCKNLNNFTNFYY